MTGAGTIATGMAIEIVTETATEPSPQFAPEKRNGAPQRIGTPRFLFFNAR